MSIKELRMKRIRNGITAKAMAEYLGVSYGWLRQVELYYRGPGTPKWQVRYETALDSTISMIRSSRSASIPPAARVLIRKKPGNQNITGSATEHVTSTRRICKSFLTPISQMFESLE